jgi:ankyrin repeat protein
LGTTLHWSAQHAPNAAPIIVLLKAGGDPNARHRVGQWTPLHFVRGEAYEQKIEALCVGGADIEARDNRGMTPLAQAAGWNRRGVVVALLERGADVNTRDNGGRTILDRTHPSHAALRKLLRDHGCLTGKELARRRAKTE